MEYIFTFEIMEIWNVYVSMWTVRINFDYRICGFKHLKKTSRDKYVI